MKTCYCCNREASDTISLDYYNFNLCNICSNTYYNSIRIINMFEL